VAYLQALDEAVAAALAGEPAAPALEKAANTWRATTASLDAEKQKAAYRRSLGVAE
jgi:hypothetical protein